MRHSTTRQCLNNEVKAAICDKHSMNPDMTQAALGEWAKKEFDLAVNQKTITNILNSSEKVYSQLAKGNNEGKSSKSNQSPDLDQDVADYSAEMNDPVNRESFKTFCKDCGLKKLQDE